MKWWDRMSRSEFSECWVLRKLFHSPLSLSSGGSLVFLCFSAIRVVSSAYLRLLIFLPAILIPACASSSSVFLVMYSAYKLNKQGDNIQPWCTPFPIWNQSIVPCPVLTVASWLCTKLEEVMELQLSYFKSWKIMLWKYCIQYASKFAKFSSGHRTGKGQFSFQYQKRQC